MNGHDRRPGEVVEARSIEWVPESERHGRTWHQGPFWFLGNLQFFTVAIGFIGPSMGLSLGWTILAGTLGIAFGTVFMALHATQGPTLGLPQMIQSRAQLGHRGVVVALFGSFVTYAGFTVAGAVLLGAGLNGLFGWSTTVVVVLAGLLAAALAIVGHDALHRAFRILLWISLPFYAVLTVVIALGLPAPGPDAEPVEGGGFLLTAFVAQFAAAAAYNISFAPYVSDVSRYLPRSSAGRAIVGWVFLGAGGSAVWLIAVGAWLAASFGSGDGLVGLRDAGDSVLPGLGTATAVLSALGLVAVMGLNAYSGMLTIVTAVDSVRAPFRPGRAGRAGIVAAFAVGWTALALGLTTDAVAAVFLALTLMLYLLVPWTALNLVDYFVVRRGRYAVTALLEPGAVYGTWNVRGLTAYGAGLLAEVPFMVLPGLYVGPVAAALGGLDLAFVVGLAVAAAVHLALARGRDAAAEEEAVALSARELETGA